MEYTSELVSRILDNANANNKKFYVYRLVDPRTLQTFYVGKGCGDRVLQHVRDAKLLINSDEDSMSLKIQQITDILGAGKQVIPIIHRRGLTEEQAFEVEAALIDCYPGLTNIRCGHDSERGVITLDDLCAIYDIKEYTEPKEKYIIIKTSLLAISERGSLYEATRLAWRANLDNAKQYQYVLAVVNGIVREVYEVKEWFQFNPDRIGFTGNVANAQIASLKGQRIPSYYCQKGNANPFLYKKQLFNH